MRIGTWNCRLNIDRKRAALDSLRLDVAVIPESSARPSLAEEAGVSHAWTGRRHEKGLGVFAVGDWSLVAVDEPPTLRWTGRGGRHFHYHCDHVLVSAALTPRVRAAEVGTLADWVESGFSDHCPVVAELAVD